MDDRPYVFENCTGKKRYDVAYYSCSQCSEKFIRRVRKAEEVKDLFCSTLCRSNYQASKHTKVNCSTCEKVIDKLTCRVKKVNFCTKECQGKYASKLHKKTREARFGIKICPTCETEFSDSTITCSSKCYLTFKYESFINNWLAGEDDGCVGIHSGINSYIRKYLHEKHNASCIECGWSKINPQTGLIPLQIHHVDGNHKNNKIENLQLLCASCHSITPNYGSLNIGNGRKYRRLNKGGDA